MMSFFAAILINCALASTSEYVRGGDFPPLSGFQVEADQRERLRQRCREIGFRSAGSREPCLRLAESGQFSQPAMEMCLGMNDASIYSCLSQIDGVEVPAGVARSCARATASSVTEDSISECLLYFRETTSSFPVEMVQFCLRRSGGSFRRARSCLNTVRDREVDASALMEECERPSSRWPDVEMCLDENSRRAPVLCNAGLRNPSGTRPREIPRRDPVSGHR